MWKSETALYSSFFKPGTITRSGVNITGRRVVWTLGHLDTWTILQHVRAERSFCQFIYFIFSKYNQQDATLYNILYYCQCCTCFRRFLRPSSGAQNWTHSIGYMSNLLAATVSVGELEMHFQLTHVTGSINQA